MIMPRPQDLLVGNGLLDLCSEATSPAQPQAPSLDGSPRAGAPIAAADDS